MITVTKKDRVPEKKYKVQTVAFAIGLSEGAVQGIFNNQKISVKSGLTIDQIEGVLNGRRRGPGINWAEVDEIRSILRQRGWYITDKAYEEEPEEGRLPL